MISDSTIIQLYIKILDQNLEQNLDQSLEQNLEQNLDQNLEQILDQNLKQILEQNLKQNLKQNRLTHFLKYDGTFWIWLFEKVHFGCRFWLQKFYLNFKCSNITDYGQYCKYITN